jgi:predicted ATPase
MITKLQLRNYKTHQDTTLNLANLTILTGLNGMGKSSIIQSLLLLRQSFFQNKEFKEGLILNGDLVEIGTGQDAVCSTAENDEFGFSCHFLETEEVKFRFIAKAAQSSDDVLALDESQSLIPTNLTQQALFNKHFQYISAEHIEPRENHPRSTRIVERGWQISHKKGRGEYAVHFLSHFNNSSSTIHQDIIKVPPGMRHPSQDSDSLSVQVNAWLSEVSPGVSVEVAEDVNSNNFALRFKFERKTDYTKAYKPQNVGFGISYALPVVLALIATPSLGGGLVLLENPEAHIHPQGQAKLVELMTRATQYNTQIIAETHSDHIINGTLVAIKKYLQNKQNPDAIHRDNVAIYFLHRSLEDDKHCALATRIEINDQARTRKTPAGFFDQANKDLSFLLGL